MTREQMLGYMENPALLNEKSLGELREILDEFPYFQTAHLLYARNLLNENNFRFANQLKICAVHATDRSVLYHLLNPEQKSQKDNDTIKVIIPAGLNETDSQIELPEDLPASTELLQKDPSQGTAQREEIHSEIPDYIAGESAYRLEGGDIESGISLSEMVKEINGTVENRINKKRNDLNEDLIDRFIKENPTISNRLVNIPEDSYSNVDQDDISNENDEFITETLAKIYIKQGLYQKAIDAFKRLSLKYPEKSVYFARQIDEVTNLLKK